jgi:hypothetical protein
MGNPMSQSIGFSGARARNDQKRSEALTRGVHPISSGESLFRIEAAEVGWGGRHAESIPVDYKPSHVSYLFAIL